MLGLWEFSRKAPYVRISLLPRERSFSEDATKVSQESESKNTDLLLMQGTNTHRSQET